MLPQAENTRENILTNTVDMPAHALLAYAGRTSRVIARVAGLLVLAGSLLLVGCEGDDTVDDLIDDLTTFDIASKPVDSTNAELLEGLNFTFSDGGVFAAGLDDDATTLVFDTVDGGSGTFTLTSGNNTASGTVAFASCDLTVTSSDFVPADGPQNGVIALPTCEYTVAISLTELTEVAPLRLTVENAEGDSATSGDADVDVAKVCSLNPDELPEDVEAEVCP